MSLSGAGLNKVMATSSVSLGFDFGSKAGFPFFCYVTFLGSKEQNAIKAIKNKYDVEDLKRLLPYIIDKDLKEVCLRKLRYNLLENYSSNTTSRLANEVIGVIRIVSVLKHEGLSAFGEGDEFLDGPKKSHGCSKILDEVSGLLHFADKIKKYVQYSHDIYKTKHL